MSESPHNQNLYVRRDFIKAVAKRSAVLVGMVAAAHLPYKKAGVKSFFGVKSAYAQVTPSFQIVITGQLGPAPLGTIANIGQDAWTFDVAVGDTLYIDVTVVSLHAEIGLFAPGDPTTGTNLLTGTGEGLVSAGVDQPINTTYGPTVAGTYTIAIEDDRENPPLDPQETSGSYVITISATQPLGSATQVITGGAETLLKNVIPFRHS